MISQLYNNVKGLCIQQKQVRLNYEVQYIGCIKCISTYDIFNLRQVYWGKTHSKWRSTCTYKILPPSVTQGTMLIGFRPGARNITGKVDQPISVPCLSSKNLQDISSMVLGDSQQDKGCFLQKVEALNFTERTLASSKQCLDKFEIIIKRNSKGKSECTCLK